MSVKILDWDEKGNVVRLFLGHAELTDWWGDDWADIPWSINAGPVYKEFVCASIDIAFFFDVTIVHAGDEFSKNHMRAREVPMFTAVDARRFHHQVWMGHGVQVLNHLPGDILRPTFANGGADA